MAYDYINILIQSHPPTYPSTYLLIHPLPFSPGMVEDWKTWSGKTFQGSKSASPHPGLIINGPCIEQPKTGSIPNPLTHVPQDV